MKKLTWKSATKEINTTQQTLSETISWNDFWRKVAPYLLNCRFDYNMISPRVNEIRNENLNNEQIEILDWITYSSNTISAEASLRLKKFKWQNYR